MKKEKDYSVKKLYNCDYNLLIWGRNSGKSFVIEQKLKEDALHDKNFYIIK